MTRQEERRSLARTILRLSVLLFVVAFVSWVGVNRGIDPQRVSRIHAHNIAIDITSNGSDDIVFAANVNCGAQALAPSDSCTANLVVQNTGDFRLQISTPDLNISGGLESCGGGDWFSVDIVNQSYSNNAILNAGNSEDFDVVIALDFDTPNDCQGQSATIAITIDAECLPDDDGCSEEEAEEPEEPESTATPVATATAVNETLGTQATPSPTPTSRPLTSEVLPSRFPVTGQGSGFEDDASEFVRLILLATGLIASGLFILSLALYSRGRQRQS